MTSVTLDPNRTHIPNPAQGQINQEWYIIDASGKHLGRLASAVAMVLRGKHKPIYTPHLDTGDYVIVINADKVEVTGKKRYQKVYKRHSGRPGGMKEENFAKLIQRLPERVIEHAVRGMLPKNRLGRRLFTKLKVYRGNSHPHSAQQPKPLTIKEK